MPESNFDSWERENSEILSVTASSAEFYLKKLNSWITWSKEFNSKDLSWTPPSPTKEQNSFLYPQEGDLIIFSYGLDYINLILVQAFML